MESLDERFRAELSGSDALGEIFFGEVSQSATEYDSDLIGILHLSGFSESEIQTLISQYGWRGRAFKLQYFSQIAVIRSTIRKMENRGG
jgi:hypothetical protein